MSENQDGIQAIENVTKEQFVRLKKEILDDIKIMKDEGCDKDYSCCADKGCCNDYSCCADKGCCSDHSCCLK